MKFKVFSIAIVFLLAFGVLMMQTAPVTAQSSAPEGGVRDKINQMREGVLERTYQRELNWLAAQEDHLNNGPHLRQQGTGTDGKSPPERAGCERAGAGIQRL